MKKLFVTSWAILLAALAMTDADAAVPLESRCISVPPICRPGTEPLCICESDYSFRCQWICTSW